MTEGFIAFNQISPEDRLEVANNIVFQIPQATDKSIEDTDARSKLRKISAFIKDKSIMSRMHEDIAILKEAHNCRVIL